MAESKIVIVEDEPDILEVLKYNLERENFRISCSTNGIEGLALAQQLLPDLVLLDLMLPGLDGLEICRSLKENTRTAHIPIVMLTAKGEESDIVLGLGMGADDYIVKPFRQKELIARVKAVLRRSNTKATDENTAIISQGSLSIDMTKHQVILDDQEVKMTATEFRLLRKLCSSPGQVFTREQLLNEGLGHDVVVVDRNIDVHIRSIRKKVGDKRIETIRGVGYRFTELEI